jgi:hypothetical protein
MKLMMKRFHELDEDSFPSSSPTQRPPVEWPVDIDQYESPHSYEYDDELPDDADLQEERENWSTE